MQNEDRRCKFTLPLSSNAYAYAGRRAWLAGQGGGSGSRLRSNNILERRRNRCLPALPSFVGEPPLRGTAPSLSGSTAEVGLEPVGHLHHWIPLPHSVGVTPRTRREPPRLSVLGLVPTLTSESHCDKPLNGSC
jgi:hypothetical protein